MKIGNVNLCKKCAENCPKLQLFNKKLAAVIYCTDYHRSLIIFINLNTFLLRFFNNVQQTEQTRR